MTRQRSSGFAGIIKAAGFTYPLAFLALGAALCVVEAPAHAANSTTLVADIRGAQETPPNASPARGCGRFVINTNTNTITYRIAFGGLTAAETAAHLHLGGPGVAGPIKIGLPLGNPKSGTLTYLEADEADILAGLWYVNIHTGPFPAGEIRGQVNSFAAALDAPQENPPAAVPATSKGWATFHIDTCTNKLSYYIMVEGLSAAEVAAHIHGMALPGANAGILHGLPAGALKTGVWNYNENQEPGILNGLTYVNIHSAAFPGGEIRGQICNTVVPLDSGQEAPPVASPAIGCGWVGLDQAANTLGYYVTYAGLTTVETAAHIHGFSPQGVNSGIQHFLTPASPANPKKGMWVYGAANAGNVLNDLTYFNIHTMMFGGGEIRGQIVIPLPKCKGDTTCDGDIDVDDLLVVINGWGPCPKDPDPCPGDTNYSGAIDVDDLLGVINGWGKCP